MQPTNPSPLPSLEAILSHAIDALAADGTLRCAIHVPRGGLLRCLVQRGLHHVHDGIPPGVGLVGRAFASGTPAIVQDLTDEVGLASASPSGGAQATLPLTAHGHVVAVLSVRKDGPFGPQELIDLMATCSRLEASISTASSSPEATSWELLSTETVALMELQERDEILRWAVERASHLLGMRSALIRRVDTDRVRVVTAGPDARSLEQLSAGSLNTIADWTGGRASVFAPGPEPAEDNAGLSALGLHTWAVTPLPGGHPADILLVADTGATPCTSEAVQVLEAYASHVISALRTAEAFERLRLTSVRDGVTGLAHAASFHDSLIAAAQHAAAHLALILVDVDNLKQVNERDGHAEGDAVLRSVASRIEAVLQTGHQLFRIGGDEFGVIVRGGSTTTALALAEQLRAAARTERTTVSIGLSVRSQQQLRRRPDPRAMVAEADMAVSVAKRRGRNRIEIYSAAMGAAILERTRMAGDLSRAIAQGQMRLVYQPQVDTSTNRVTGAEALLRWVTADRGSVSPAMFIPIAEETGDIVPMGAWALRQAVHQAAEWDLDAHDMRLSVNVSGLQLRAGFVEEVSKLLSETSLPPQRLVLEITESSLVDDEHRIGLIRGLHDLGITVAIDDFGTGYSSLSYLRRLPIDVLKMDRSFVGELHDQRNAAVARTIIELTKVLSLDCVAEGIETPEQLALLSDLGCRVVQGFHFAKPMEAGEFMAFAAAFGSGVSAGPTS